MSVPTKHLTYANVVATLALIVAVAGIPSAVAITSKLKKNSVGTKQIKKGAITPSKLANAAVTSAKISDGSVTGTKLAGTRIAADHNAPGVNADVGCAPGERMLGGGAASGGGTLESSFPGITGAGWSALGNGGGDSAAFALCLKNTPGS